MENRLLILSCSQKKKVDSEFLPAIDRYDGPAYQLLRKYLRKTHQPIYKLDIYILSAKFGLIASDIEIPFYDQLMTDRRADELKTPVFQHVRDLLTNRKYKEVFISGGKNYLRVLSQVERFIPSDCKIYFSDGTQGRKLSELYEWLYGKPPILPSIRIKKQNTSSKISGMAIKLSKEEILETGRQALREKRNKPDNYQSWYVQIDNHKVAPKWLVSQITGIPVKRFTTGQALRILARQNIKALRV